MQLAINGKIYVASNNGYLSVINNPNNSGLSCNFQDSAISLNGRFSSLGLPNFIDSYDYSNTTYDCGNGIAEIGSSYDIVTFPNPFNVSTTLQLSQPLQSATLTIYDVLGKEIKQLQNLNGTEIIINREGIKSGMYFFRLMDKEGLVGIGKMVVE